MFGRIPNSAELWMERAGYKGSIRTRASRWRTGGKPWLGLYLHCEESSLQQEHRLHSERLSHRFNTTVVDALRLWCRCCTFTLCLLCAGGAGAAVFVPVLIVAILLIIFPLILLGIFLYRRKKKCKCHEKVFNNLLSKYILIWHPCLTKIILQRLTRFFVCLVHGWAARQPGKKTPDPEHGKIRVCTELGKCLIYNSYAFKVWDVLQFWIFDMIWHFFDI